MLWAVALLLALLPAGSTQPSGLAGGMASITRKPGSYVVITCTIHKEKNYIHWYLLREGQAPRHLLYYDFFTSKAVVGSEFNPGKYHVYEGTERSYKFVLRNVEESDSGVYYCAIWERHNVSRLPLSMVKRVH